ncbi:MAG: HEAT repeat domain-containing protein, partial [Myxococcota bacterium]|nr:HEAT repeat domain-containing protein [Myxococcota bacterium]
METARDEVLRALGSPDEEVRRMAVERLGTLPDAEGLPALVERLGDASWRVRKAAIEALVGSPRPEAAVRTLVRALADGDNPGRRNAALEALTRCGAPAVEALLEASTDPDVDVRKQVVDALAGIGDAAAAPRLRRLLADADANVRGAAADALGAVGADESADELLRAAAGDPEPLVRLSALRALSRLEVACGVEDLQGALDDAVLRPAALALLGASDDPAAEDRLLKGLAEGGRAGREAAMDAVVRLAARRDGADADRLAERVRETARAEPQLVQTALDRLEGGALPTRLVVVQFLALARDPASVVPMLHAGLDEALLEVVLGALSGFGDAAAARLDAAWEDLDPRVRLLACELLGRLETDAGVERLRAALGAPDPGLRAAAARALGRRRVVPALGELVAQLEAAASREDEVGEEVAEALTEGILGIASADGEVAERALAMLAGRLEGAGESYRFAVARILGAIGRPGETERLALL